MALYKKYKKDRTSKVGFYFDSFVWKQEIQGHVSNIGARQSHSHSLITIYQTPQAQFLVQRPGRLENLSRFLF